MSGVLRTESLGNETLDGLTQCLCRRAAEHLFRRSVEQDNVPLVVNGNDGVHRRLDDPGQLGLAFTQRFLRLFALRDVTQYDGEKFLPAGHDLGDGGLDLKFLTVRPRSPQCAYRTHGPVGDPGFGELPYMSCVGRVEALRNEALNGLPQRLCRWATEHSLSSSVEQHDPLLAVHSDDCVHRRADNASLTVLALAQCLFGHLAPVMSRTTLE